MGPRGGLRLLCKCACGVVREQSYVQLSTKVTQSCGCLQKEVVRRLRTTHGASSVRASANLSGMYPVWVAMKARCSNPKASDYARYGGRGIEVCGRWRESFENFLADMGERPSDCDEKGRSLWSIDRIDPKGNYEPGNCRWATHRQQVENKVGNQWVKYQGKKTLMGTLCLDLGISFSNVRRWMYKFGLTPTEAVDRVVANGKKYWAQRRGKVWVLRKKK